MFFFTFSFSFKLSIITVVSTYGQIAKADQTGFWRKKEHFRCLRRERSSKIIRKRRELRVTEPVAYVFLGVDASLLPTRNLLLITSIFNAGKKARLIFYA